MTVPSSNVHLSDIQGEFGGKAPISLSEYYKSNTYVTSYQAPAPSQADVPQTGAISMGHFKGIIKTLDYIAPSFDEQSGKLDINAFGTKVPADNNWYNLVSKVNVQFTTGNNPRGYTLKLPSTQATLYGISSVFWYTNNPNNKWYRYWKIRNFGWRIFNSVGGIHGTYIGPTPQYSTGFHTITNLLSNSTYTVRYCLEFMGENYGGYSAATYAPNGFFGYVVRTQDPGPYRLVLIANQ